MVCRSRQRSDLRLRRQVSGRIDRQPNNDGREKLVNLRRLMMGARN